MDSVKLAVRPQPATVPDHEQREEYIYRMARSWALRWLGERYLLANPVKPKEIVK